MRSWRTRICALLVALAMMPGAFEALENAVHLVTEGHFAHAESHGDRHTPAGPEHGCTPMFHSCACHSGLACLIAPPPPKASLEAQDFFRPRGRGTPRTGFALSLDRPPQA